MSIEKARAALTHARREAECGAIPWAVFQILNAVEALIDAREVARSEIARSAGGGEARRDGPGMADCQITGKAPWAVSHICSCGPCRTWRETSFSKAPVYPAQPAPAAEGGEPLTRYRPDWTMHEMHEFKDGDWVIAEDATARVRELEGERDAAISALNENGEYIEIVEHSVVLLDEFEVSEEGGPREAGRNVARAVDKLAARAEAAESTLAALRDALKDAREKLYLSAGYQFPAVQLVVKALDALLSDPSPATGEETASPDRTVKNDG